MMNTSKMPIAKFHSTLRVTSFVQITLTSQWSMLSRKYLAEIYICTK